MCNLVRQSKNWTYCWLISSCVYWQLVRVNIEQTLPKLDLIIVERGTMKSPVSKRIAFSQCLKIHIKSTASNLKNFKQKLD